MIFEDENINLDSIVCHSGGAIGSDSYWESIGAKYGVKTMAYSYKTSNHKSINKVEISESDYQEGISEVNKANRHLGRFGINRYMNLLARNWAQVKYSSQIFAVGMIIEPGKKSSKGYYSKSKFQTLDGGTSWCVQMGINNRKCIYVFDQIQEKWFRWSYDTMSFLETDIPEIKTENFAGVGTREINDAGINAIIAVFEGTSPFQHNVYKKTFQKK